MGDRNEGDRYTESMEDYIRAGKYGYTEEVKEGEADYTMPATGDPGWMT